MLGLCLFLFGQKDGEYDLVSDIEKEGFKATHMNTFCILEKTKHSNWLIAGLNMQFNVIEVFVKVFVVEGNSCA